MRTPARALAAVFVLVSVFALGACSGAEDPLAGADGAATPGPGSDPAVELTEIPEAATERSEAGAEAFVRYYFETVVNQTYRTGDLENLIRYSHPQCIVCRATIGDVASAYGRGEVASGGVSIEEVEATEVNSELTNVAVTYSVSRYVEVDADGDTVFSSPAKTGIDLIVQLQYSKSLDAWQVREIVNRDRLTPSTASPEPG